MFVVQPNQIIELCQMAAWADREARSDLFGGYIRDEDDYTSNFTGALRRIVNSNSTTGLRATSYMLDTPEERITGTDAAIIVSSQGESKIALFEAKMPFDKGMNRYWDYPQTAGAKDSHFADQIRRQSKLRNEFAVFEMFYCDFPFGSQPSWMQNDMSSCAWHSDAAGFDGSRSTKGPWSMSDLQGLLSAHGTTISQVLLEFATCKRGKPIRMDHPGDVIAQEFRLPARVLQITVTETVA